MSKRIQLTPEIIEECKAEFLASMEKFRATDGKFSFSKKLDECDDEAVLYFTETAWYRMKALVDGTDKEIAWHGVTERGDDNDYYVDDILVYPQEVSAATVNTDQARYDKWLMELPDETFNNMKFQGHSHVNMGVTPSGTDKAFYEGRLGQVSEDGYYIFLIINKKAETWINIYDMKKNILFEKSDIDLRIIPDKLGIVDFVEESMEMIETPKPLASKGKRDTSVSKTSVAYYDSDEENEWWSSIVRRCHRTDGTYDGYYDGYYGGNYYD